MQRDLGRGKKLFLMAQKKVFSLSRTLSLFQKNGAFSQGALAARPPHPLPAGSTRGRVTAPCPSGSRRERGPVYPPIPFSSKARPSRAAEDFREKRSILGNPKRTAPRRNSDVICNAPRLSRAALRRYIVSPILPAVFKIICADADDFCNKVCTPIPPKKSRRSGNGVVIWRRLRKRLRR